MTSLDETAERFAAGEIVLVGGDDGSEVIVALLASATDRRGLERLYAVAGDLVLLGLDPEITDRLALNELAGVNRHRPDLCLTVPIDAADRAGSGWSLIGQAHTIRVAADPGSGPEDLTVPGHVHPARIDPAAPGAPSRALELARAAGEPAAVALSAVRDRAGRPVSLAQALTDPRLRALAVAPAVALRSRAVARELVSTAVTCELPTRLGAFTAVAHAVAPAGDVVVALIHGDPGARPRPLVASHVACLLGDTFGSLLCPCHAELEQASRAIIEDGAGILLYVKPLLDDPFACPRGRAVDPALAGALVDVAAARLQTCPA